MVDPFYDIYTDGACKRGLGTWSFVILNDEGNECIHECSGVVYSTDSLRMEITAAINALSTIAIGVRVRLNTDSKILIEFFEGKRVVPEKKPNRDLWLELANKIASLKLEWRWVKAHSGNIWNERCDDLCVIARETYENY